MPKTDAVVDRLYQLPLQEFTAERDALSKRRGASGADVKGLQKPNLPAWAAGLSSKVEQVDGQWFADSPMGRIELTFAPRNEYGVLDHTVTLASGEATANPMRVIPDGAGCEVVFTLRRRPGMTDDDYAADADAVQADLNTLKHLLEKA